jgi:hypothetical protein
MELVALAYMPELLSEATSFRRLKCVLLGYVSGARDRALRMSLFRHSPTVDWSFRERWSHAFL